MNPMETAIVETLQRSGPCCFDDVVTSLPNSSWGEVFAAVDRMSRDGRLVLHQRGFSTYQLSLGSQFVHSGSTSPQMGQASGDMPRSQVSA
jgi:hypothetical protein